MVTTWRICGPGFRGQAILFHGSRDSITGPWALLLDSVTRFSATLPDVNGDSWPDYGFIAWTDPSKLNICFGGPAMNAQRDQWFGSATGRPLGEILLDDFDGDHDSELIGWSTDNQTPFG